MIEMIEVVVVNELPSYAILTLISLILVSISILLMGILLRLFTWSKDHNWNFFYNKDSLSGETPTEKVRLSFQEDRLEYFLPVLLKAWLGYVAVFATHAALLVGIGVVTYGIYKLWHMSVW